MDDLELEVDGIKYVRAESRATLQVCRRDEVPDRAFAGDGETRFWWQDKDNPDLVWTKILLDCEGANANWDYMPRPALLKHFATAKFKPMDMDHIVKENASLVGMDKSNPPCKNAIFGVMTHVALANANGDPLTDDEIKDLDNSDDMNRVVDDRVTVVAYAALYNFLFPKTTADMIKGIGNGTMHCSMERWIREFDFIVADPKADQGFASVTRADASKNGIATKWGRREFHNGQAVLRRSLNFLYGGVASTKNPANSLSTYLETSVPKSVASVTAHDPVLKNLLERHSQVHQMYDVSSVGEKDALVQEHLHLHLAISALTRT